jgi:hypothetical protein
MVRITYTNYSSRKPPIYSGYADPSINKKPHCSEWGFSTYPAKQALFPFIVFMHIAQNLHGKNNDQQNSNSVSHTHGALPFYAQHPLNILQFH